MSFSKMTNNKDSFTFFSEEYLDDYTINTIIKNILKLPCESIENCIKSTRKTKIVYDTYIINIIIIDKKNHAGQPMLDLIIYKGIINIEETYTKAPNYIVEITKNDSGDSGNQCYQRLEKFGYAKIIWKEEYEIMEKY